ncbi:hypothetical protein L208DRAFT_1378321 [Tricholoma matsutake]|nr:hypothetical protein L208DRAFT_1378321 [Tricholoma matsutake 945]
MALNAPNVEVVITESTLVLQAGTLMEYMGPAKLTELQKVHIEWVMFHIEYFVMFVLMLCPAFIVPDWSSFFPKHLAQEVAAWGEVFKKFLENQHHLIFLLDGWSTCACVSVMEEALLGVVIKILLVYGPHKYSAVTADGGPNVQSTKIKLNAMYLWILNIYDPCHNLNLFMKDVRKLFKDIIKLQDPPWHHLNEEHKKQGVTEGIKSNLEMHFSSSYYQVVSAKKLIPYIEDSVTHYGFMVQMASFIHLLATTTNSLLTLEGQNTNCADVFYVWHPISTHENSFGSRTQIQRLFHRVKEFIAYAYNKEPFSSQQWSQDTKPLKWWNQVSKDSNAWLIGQVAIKVFSITPSKICDEPHN